MNELTREELELISGAGWLDDLVQDIEKTIDSAPRIYDKAINATSEMMCRATGKC